LPEREIAPVQTLMEGIPRNFEVFDPLDFLAEVTQHIPNTAQKLRTMERVPFGTRIPYAAEAKLTTENIRYGITSNTTQAT